LLCDSLRSALEKLRNWEDGWNITDDDVQRVQESDAGKVVASLRARIEVLEKAMVSACIRLGIVNDPAYSGYTHDLCNEVIYELCRRAKEG